MLTLQIARGAVLAGADIELRKRFDQGRFEPHGRLVGEKLIDERLYTE